MSGKRCLPIVDNVRSAVQLASSILEKRGLGNLAEDDVCVVDSDWPEAYTDGSTIYLSRYLVLNSSVEKLAWILLHEHLHRLLDHVTRAAFMPSDGLVNIAADYVVELLTSRVARDLANIVYGSAKPPLVEAVEKLLAEAGEKPPADPVFEDVYWRLVRTRRMTIVDFERVAEIVSLAPDSSVEATAASISRRVFVERLSERISSRAVEVVRVLARVRGRRELSRRLALRRTPLRPSRRVEGAPGVVAEPRRLPSLYLLLDTSASVPREALARTVAAVRMEARKVGYRSIVLVAWHTRVYRFERVRVTGRLVDAVERGGTRLSTALGVALLAARRGSAVLIVSDFCVDTDDLEESARLVRRLRGAGVAVGVLGVGLVCEGSFGVLARVADAAVLAPLKA